MDDLTRERYGQPLERYNLPADVERPSWRDTRHEVMHRREILCGTASLAVVDFPITSGSVAERRLQQLIRESA